MNLAQLSEVATPGAQLLTGLDLREIPVYHQSQLPNVEMSSKGKTSFLTILRI